MFPPVRTFIVTPSLWYSRTATPTAVVGSLYDATEFPLSAVVDGDVTAICRFATLSAGVRLTFSGSQDLNFIALCNHNLDPQLLIEVWANGVKLPRTFSVQYPNCWMDLRGFIDPLDADAVYPCTTIEIRVYGNSRPICFGEVAAGKAYSFDGTIELPFSEAYATVTSRHRTDTGKATQEWGTGVVGRRLQLQLQVPAADISKIDTVTSECGLYGLKALVIPSTRRNDVWLVRWPNVHPARFPNAALVTVPLDLIEEPGGLMV